MPVPDRVPAGPGGVPFGPALARAAFTPAELSDVDSAVAAVQRLIASPVVPTLILAIDPRQWPQTRSAVSGLRRQGPAAISAIPAIAGWLKLCAHRATTNEQQYTVHDILLALADLRRLAGTLAPAEPGPAADRLARFLDEAFQPYLLSVLVAPLRIWHRGAVSYLRGQGGDVEALAESLRRFATTLLDAPAEHDDWYSYLRMELFALIADLGPRLERIALERDLRARPEPFSEADGDEADGDEADGGEADGGDNEDDVGGPRLVAAGVSGIFVFDDRYHREVVVPALRALSDGGPPAPVPAWLVAAWRWRHGLRRPDPAPLPGLSARVRTASGPLFARPDLACRRAELARDSAQVLALDPVLEDLRYLFQSAVERTCVGAGTGLGTATLPTTIAGCAGFASWHLADRPDLWPLLRRLGQAGSAWALGGDTSPGIHGWLDADDTAALVAALDRLPLPYRGADLAAIQAATSAGTGTCPDGGDCAGRLAALRAVAALAVRRGYGVLWGTGLARALGQLGGYDRYPAGSVTFLA